jgi:hypothetical protein
LWITFRLEDFLAVFFEKHETPPKMLD